MSPYFAYAEKRHAEKKTFSSSADTMLVNGTAFPKVTVEPRRYRLRFLNACNARSTSCSVD